MQTSIAQPNPKVAGLVQSKSGDKSVYPDFNAASISSLAPLHIRSQKFVYGFPSEFWFGDLPSKSVQNVKMHALSELTAFVGVKRFMLLYVDVYIYIYMYMYISLLYGPHPKERPKHL